MRGGEKYLKMYPELDRWMNRCIACQRIGYKPEMPKQISRPGSAAARNIRKYFSPLEIDGDGLCEQCRDAQILEGQGENPN